MSDKSEIARTVPASEMERRRIERRIRTLREEMIQWQNDLEHWNRLHPDEPILFEEDIQTYLARRLEERMKGDA